MSGHLLGVVGLLALAAGCASTVNPDASSFATSDVRPPLAASEAAVEVVSTDELFVDFDGSAEERRVICREMLQPASNQIVSRCMRQADWRIYDRAQEEWARRVLRQMQGSPYR
jgi:hypothetical protein